ncbi:MAG: alpha/beta hydrolase-fold protein [Planctomycetota bacterium]|nr:alpha/beta hydrolase-fold protein [Planctomycetota bacterium]
MLIRKLPCFVIALTFCVSPVLAQEQSNKKKKTATFQWVNPAKSNIPGLKHATFRSPSMDLDVGYFIYLPPGYEMPKNAEKKYPVVYYIHGGRPGSEKKSISLAAFVHRATQSKQIDPTIYVFINGGPVSHYNYPQKKNAMGEDVFIKELIPHIDGTYRTIADRSGRGIEGFSQGGRGTMRIIMKHPNLFCSAAPGGGGYETEKRISEEGGRESDSLIFAEGYNTWDLARSYSATMENDNAANFRMLVFVGDKGFNYENNLEFMSFLKTEGIPFERLVVPDAPHSAKIIYEKRSKDILDFHQKSFRAATKN